MSHEDEEDEEDEEDCSWFFNSLIEMNIKSLLCGNDTQCFTTTQYIERRDEDSCDFVKKATDPHRETEWFRDLARGQLRAFPHLITEIKPDIWVSNESYQSNSGLFQDTTGPEDRGA